MAFDTSQQYSLANYTPYTMTLTNYPPAADQPGNPDWTCWPLDGSENPVYPALTIPPGANMTFLLLTQTLANGSSDYLGTGWAETELHYDITDVNGDKHRCQYNVRSDASPWVLSEDWSDGTYVESTATFYIHNEGNNQIDCILTNPAEATIDASNDLATATWVMANLWPDGTNKDYTPTTGLTFTPVTPWERGSAMAVNETNEKVTFESDAGSSTSETTSLSLTLAWSSSLDILDLVNEKLSASITGGVSWSKSVAISTGYGMTLDKGQQGYLQWCTTVAQVTGDFTFIWTPPAGVVAPAGITYHVNNVTINQPAPSQTSITWEPYIELIPPPIPSSPAVTQAVASRQMLMAGDTTVVIDAVTDPDAAATAMGLWPTATNTSFTATSDPVYSATEPQQLGPKYQIPADYTNPGQFTYSQSMTNDMSWSLSGSISSETTLSALGFANASLSITFTAGHAWDSSYTNTQTVTFNIDPGYVGWVEGSIGQVTFTGDFAFTANGTDYVVKNVTITNPGAGADSGPETAFTYYAVTEPISATLAADAITLPESATAPSVRPGPKEGKQAPSAKPSHEHEESTPEQKHGNGRPGHGQSDKAKESGHPKNGK